MEELILIQTLTEMEKLKQEVIDRNKCALIISFLPVISKWIFVSVFCFFLSLVVFYYDS